MASNENWEEVPTEQWEEVPLTEEEKKPPQRPEYDPDSFIENYAIPGLQSLGAGITDVVGGASMFVDKYTGAPMRAGVQKIAQGRPGEALQAAYQQFNEDPTKAPSGKDIAAGLGVSTKEYETPFIVNPYVSSGGKLKVSPAGLVGGAAEFALDPLNVVPFKTIGKAAVKTAQVLGNAGAAAGRAIAPPLGKIIARVPPDTTRAFIKSPAEIEATARTYQVEDIKNILDETVDQARRGVAGAEEKKKALEDMLRQKMLDRKRELQTATVPVSAVGNIQGALENQKRILGQLSTKADEALVKSGVTFQKQDLLNLIDGIGKSLGPYAIGDARVSALNKLYATRQRIADAMPDIIQAQELRDVLKQLRDDIDFDLNAGEFNSDLNMMRKEFSARISNALKQQVPEYSRYMGGMSRLADSLEKMSDLFGSQKNPMKGIGALQNIRKGQNAQSQYLQKILLENAELTKNENIPRLIQQFNSDSALLERMKRGEDVSKFLYPDDVNAISQAEEAVSAAQRKYEPVKRLTPYTDKTQSVIRRQGTPTASIEDARALKAAGELAGVNIPEIIRQRNVFDAFEKDATTGARGAVMGASAGSMLGLDAALGGLAGGALDRYSGRLLRSSISGGTKLKASFDNMLNYLRTDPQFAEKYGRKIESALKYGTRTGLLYHRMLLNNDPGYRAYFQEAE